MSLLVALGLIARACRAGRRRLDVAGRRAGRCGRSRSARDPYAGGQHRGIDIGGADRARPVRAAAAGVVSFAGTVPGNGLTRQDPDGGRLRGDACAARLAARRRGPGGREGDTVGTVGPSAESEHAEPYVHLGVRITADEHGYVDPLSLLPARQPVPPPPPAPLAPSPADRNRSRRRLPVAPSTAAQPATDEQLASGSPPAAGGHDARQAAGSAHGDQPDRRSLRLRPSGRRAVRDAPSAGAPRTAIRGRAARVRRRPSEAAPHDRSAPTRLRDSVLVPGARPKARPRVRVAQGLREPESVNPPAGRRRRRSAPRRPARAERPRDRRRHACVAAPLVGSLVAVAATRSQSGSGCGRLSYH